MRRGGDQRVLATVLFTDIVRSTDLAVEMGDRRWRTLLSRHHEIIRRELKRFGGREVDTAGDGFFAIFDSPASAVRSAHACTEGVRELGIEIRAGLHTGEVELEGKQARGVGVHTGARVMSKAGAGEVLVTSTVHDVVAGSGLTFEDGGSHGLKGVPGTWHLWRLETVDGDRVKPPLGDAEAAGWRASIQGTGARGLSPAIIGGLAGAAVVIGISVFLVTRSGGGEAAVPPASPTSTGPRTGDVIKFDPETGDLLLEPTVGVVPTRTKGISIARGEGSIWVDSSEEPTLTPIDEGSGIAGEETPIGFGGEGLVVEGPYVWVVANNELFRINPGSRETESIFRGQSFGVLPMVAGEGTVWAAVGGELLWFDVETGEEIRRTAIEIDVLDLAYADGSLWALDKLAGQVVQIDSRTGKAGAPLQLSGNLDAVVAGEGYAWILDETAGSITPVDADTGGSQPPIRVGEAPAGMAIGLGSLWVGDFASAELWRINPLTLQPEHIETPAPVAAIVADEGDHSLWLALSEERTATQF